MDGRTSRWRAHNDAQRRRIVAAAIDLYDEGRPGASLHEIGERAGVSRSLVYRQFADRRDLDDAVQRHVLAELWERLAPAFADDPSPESFRRATSVYVEWAAAHPRLHQVADLDRGADGPLQRAITHLSAKLAWNLLVWLRRTRVPLAAEDEAAVDALAYGVIGLGFSTVKRWVDRGDGIPDADHLAELLAASAWAVVDARVRAWGIPLGVLSQL